MQLHLLTACKAVKSLPQKVSSSHRIPAQKLLARVKVLFFFLFNHFIERAGGELKKAYDFARRGSSGFC